MFRKPLNEQDIHTRPEYISQPLAVILGGLWQYLMALKKR